MNRARVKAALNSFDKWSDRALNWMTILGCLYIVGSGYYDIFWSKRYPAWISLGLVFAGIHLYQKTRSDMRADR